LLLTFYDFYRREQRVFTDGFFTEGNEGNKGNVYRSFLNSSTVKPAAPIIPPMVMACIGLDLGMVIILSFGMPLPLSSESLKSFDLFQKS